MVRLLASLGFAAVVLLADTKTVTKYSSGSASYVSIHTEYVQGEKVRREINVERARQRIGKIHQAIITTDRQIEYQLDFKLEEYMERPIPPRPPIRSLPPASVLPLRLAQPAAPAQPGSGDSGKTLDVYNETIDTGETKELFGKTVKHLIWRRRIVAEAGACEPSRTT